MIRKLTLSLVAATAVLAAGCASTMSASPAKAVDGALVGANGMTLYIFDKDTAGAGKSVCNGPCAQNWPPLVAAAGAASDGDWAVIYNDLPEGRHSLAVSLSDDEGATWKWTRHLERVEEGKGRFHYPSIIEGSDGNLHCTYSYFEDGGDKRSRSIKYATFNKAWIKQGDPQ